MSTRPAVAVGPLAVRHAARSAATVLALAALAGCGSSEAPRLRVASGTVRASIGTATSRSISGETLSGMSFPTARVGYLVTADGRLLVSSNAGRGWRMVGRLAPAILDFVSVRVGFALTDTGLLWQTDNGGRGWRLVRRFRTGTDGPFHGAVDFVDRSHGWVTPTGYPSRIYRTDDGGKSWSLLRAPACSSFAGLSFLGPRRGFSACTGQPATIMSVKELYATSDGGTSWRLIGRTHLFGAGRDLPNIPSVGYADAIQFRSMQEGFLTAERLGIYVTRNGGRSWRISLFTDDAYQVIQDSWPTARVAFALLGPRSALLRSTDGGRRWQVVSSTHRKTRGVGP